MLEDKRLFNATLVFLIKGDHVLLGIKRKKIGAGKRNGYGGEIHNGETPGACAARETWEEAEVVLQSDSLDEVAVVYFENTNSDGATSVCKVHVYFAYEWEGDPQETDEVGDPQWFHKDHLPLENMMPADRHWLPAVLAGERLMAKASYGPFQQELLAPVTMVQLV